MRECFLEPAITGSPACKAAAAASKAAQPTISCLMFLSHKRCRTSARLESLKRRMVPRRQTLDLRGVHARAGDSTASMTTGCNMARASSTPLTMYGHPEQFAGITALSQRGRVGLVPLFEQTTLEAVRELDIRWTKRKTRRLDRMFRR